MKIVAISDTHGLHHLVPELPQADVFIHAGDFMNHGTNMQEIQSFKYWLNDKVPFPKERKLVVAGNHDIWFDSTHRMSSPNTCVKAERELKEVCTYLNEESITIEGVKMYFSPWTPRFFNWGFNADRGEEIKKHWDKIPEDTEVLVTHGPPHGILDQIAPGNHPLYPHIGCEELLNRIKELPKLKYHIFGHIHGSRGQMIYRMDGKFIDPCFVNASFLDERYRPHVGPGYFLLEI